MNEIFDNMTYVSTIGIALGFLLSFIGSLIAYVIRFVFDTMKK